MKTPDKKILHIIGSAGKGGGERYLLDLVRFASPGFRHTAVVPHVGQLSRDMDSAANVYKIIDMPRWPSAASVVKVCRFCRETGADIVHTHGFRANMYGRLVALLCRKPHVATIHVSLFDYLETFLIRRVFYRLVEKWSSPITSRFICVSEAMAKDTLKLGVRADRVVVINNGVDTESFCGGYDIESIKKRFDINDRQPVIGTVGRLVREKGQSDLIAALATLKDDFPELVCLFVGEGPLLEELKQQAMATDVLDMCRFIGPVAEIDEVYAILDLFVLPSLREPFGLVILEAMASNVAVLTTDAGGPAEYIRSGVNGLLVTPGKPLEMAGATKKVLSDRPLRKKIAKAGRQTVIERFNIRTTVRRIEDVYASL